MPDVEINLRNQWKDWESLPKNVKFVPARKQVYGKPSVWTKSKVKQ